MTRCYQKDDNATLNQLLQLGSSRNICLFTEHFYSFQPKTVAKLVILLLITRIFFHFLRNLILLMSKLISIERIRLHELAFGVEDIHAQHAAVVVEIAHLDAVESLGEGLLGSALGR